MPQTTDNLPNGGKTSFYAVSYDEGLSEPNGHDLAVDLMNFLDDDLSLIISWFVGVNFPYSFPINVQITGNKGGASWTPLPYISAALGYSPTVVLSPGSSPTTGYLRYLVVSEVTEMYMLSQGKGWYEPGNFFSPGDEGSMGESLSRFLGAQFVITTGVSTSLFGHSVVLWWLNLPGRPNWIDSAPDDHSPDMITGCGTCFLFFLHDQRHYSIQKIIAANGYTLAEIYQSLTGESDAWQSFSKLVEDHYPPSSGPYCPPLDNIFPVGELSRFVVPPVLSWVSNGPNVAVVIFNPVAPIQVVVALISDDPALIGVPATVKITTSVNVSLDVPQQPAAFTSKTVHLTASHAGQQIEMPVEVVRPENLPLPPLIIKPSISVDDPCSNPFIATTSVSFYVANPNVIYDSTGLTYKWTVTGAVAPQTDQPTLTIPSLPAAGTEVTIALEMKNTYGIHANGTFDFITASGKLTLADMIREVNCRVGRYQAINKNILPWVPIEIGDPAATNERLAVVENRAKQQIEAGKTLIESIEKVRTAIQER